MSDGRGTEQEEDEEEALSIITPEDTDEYGPNAVF